MKKVIVIGCPGSGKSTFARVLHEKTGLPLYHLDMLYWNAVLRTDAWIIDGHYGTTLELRLRACDTVIILDYPAAVCLNGVRERRGTPRTDLPWTEATDEEDAEFLAMIRDFSVQSRPQLLKLPEQYPDKTVHIFTDRREADLFLSGL